MLPAISTAACFAGTAGSFFGYGFALARCNWFTAFKSLFLSFFAYTAGAVICTIFATAAVAAGFTIFTAGAFGKSVWSINTATVCTCCKNRAAYITKQYKE